MGIDMIPMYIKCREALEDGTDLDEKTVNLGCEVRLVVWTYWWELDFIDQYQFLGKIAFELFQDVKVLNLITLWVHCQQCIAKLWTNSSDFW